MNNIKHNIELFKNGNKKTTKITKKIHEFEHDYKQIYLYYILCCFYSMMPILRSEDYFNTYLFLDASKEETANKNYLDLATKRLVISQYKTAESHGIREIQISDKLAKILTDYKNDLNFSFLVCSPTGHQLVSSSFNRLSNECVDLSSSMMRKIYVSSEVIDKNVSINKKKEIAHIMGHSVNKKANTYSKFSKLLHTDNANVEDLLKQRKILMKLVSDIDNKVISKLKLDDS